MTTILVTGGTGTLGRRLTERLRADGHEVRVLSRHSRPYVVDLRDVPCLVQLTARNRGASAPDPPRTECPYGGYPSL